jgi:phosphate transport system substrate-binding protein
VLIVRKLEANKNAFGIFGFSFLDQNADKIQGSVVEGVEPTFDNIAKSAYPVSGRSSSTSEGARRHHPGMKEFVNEFASEKAWGTDGYLADKGLIPMPDAERKQFHDAAMSLANNVMM